MAVPVGDSYSCESGGSIAAGRHTISLTTALMGDSLTDDSYGLTSFYGINGLTGGKMKLLANSGVQANTVGDMLARVDNNYLHANPGMAGLGTVGRIFVRAGTNNARGNIAIASIAATYTSLLNKLAGYAQRVVILAVPPLADAGMNATATTYNAWLANFAASNPSKFKWVDDCVNVRNADGTQKAVCFNVDGVHFVGAGVARAGASGAAAIAPELATYPSALSTHPDDVYPDYPQWFVNPTIAGASGTKDGSFAGVVANGLWVGGYGAGMAGICSIVPADVGDTNQTPWQRITLSAGQVGSRLDIASTLAGREITPSDPARLDAIAEIRVTDLDCSRIDGLSMMAQGGTGEYFVPSTAINFNESGLESKTYVLRARRPRSGSSIPASIGWHIYAGVRSAFGPAASVGTIDIRCITVRG